MTAHIINFFFPSPKVPEKEAGTLAGVVICVGKKLSKMQSELNAVAASLGADFRYPAHFYLLQIPKSVVLEVMRGQSVQTLN